MSGSVKDTNHLKKASEVKLASNKIIESGKENEDKKSTQEISKKMTSQPNLKPYADHEVAMKQLKDITFDLRKLNLHLCSVFPGFADNAKSIKTIEQIVKIRTIEKIEKTYTAEIKEQTSLHSLARTKTIPLSQNKLSFHDQLCQTSFNASPSGLNKLNVTLNRTGNRTQLLNLTKDDIRKLYTRN